MRRIRAAAVVFSLVLLMVANAEADVSVSVGIGTPHLSIGINVPAYPHLYPVPGYPVYYAPQVYGNYFFYDGFFWAYQSNDWYMSYWYNGPWFYVEPVMVPLFVLRVPVFYYMRPPKHFRGWPLRSPPHWGAVWGPQWEQHRKGWDHWEHRNVPKAAPLPSYQRQYFGNHYPSWDQQRQLSNKHYRYQPRDLELREKILPQMNRQSARPDQQGRVEDSRGQGRQGPQVQQRQPPTAPQEQGSPQRWRQEPRKEQIPERKHKEQEYKRRLHPYGYEKRVRERFAPRPQDSYDFRR